MLQRSIFEGRSFIQKMANYRIHDTVNLSHTTEVIAKYIKALDSGKIERTKEESIQADFINKFFGDILGYDYNDPVNWNLEKEYKVVTDSSKADGALGYFTIDGKKIKSDVRAVIELKDALTDLDKPQNRIGDKRTPVEQAFSYSSKAGGRCRWVIVSNFKEIRLYHASDQSRYENFILDKLLVGDNLKRFFFFLQNDRLISQNNESEVDTLFNERQDHEQKITKEFYSGYKLLRMELFEHIKQNNSGKDEMMVLIKTQKILDRFIFICFCVNASLLPPDTLKKIKDITKNAFDFEPDKLWRQLKGLFHSIDSGNPPLDINKFNGGLFKKDEELDNFILRDEILFKLIHLSENDFSSDLNVNILGHIFEQSISDIEKLKARIGNGEALSEDEIQDVHKNGKRKKEGIFYTPEHITRYIVKQAIGGWLDDVRQDLGFFQLPELTKEDYASVKIIRQKNKVTGRMFEKLAYNSNITRHIEFWEAYKGKLRQIKVLDPACGSGAFLNQAFDYLHAEGVKVNDELSLLRLGQREIFELDRHILTNNLFGVDINQESVEITKLSLWLKTANKGKELTSLDENIKWGNSLIDDPNIASDRAFDWFSQFPAVFPNFRKPHEQHHPEDQDIVKEPSYNYKNPESRGFTKYGFDVVIGNPPWGAEMDDRMSTWLLEKYPVIPGKIKDTYLYFTLLALNLLKINGYLGFIIPNTWLLINNAKAFREFLLKFNIKQIVDHGDNVFADAIVECTTLILNKSTTTNSACETIRIKDGNQLFTKLIDKNLWLKDDLRRIVLELDLDTYEIINRLENETEPFSKKNEIIFGIKPYQVGHGIPAQTREDVLNRIYHSSTKLDNLWFPLVTGTDVTRYHLSFNNDSFIKYGKWLMYASNEQKIKDAKILLRRTSSDLKATYDNQGFYPQNSVFIITSTGYHLLFLLVLLNSKLFDFIYKLKCPQEEKVFAEVKPSIIKTLPIPVINEDEQMPFVNLAITMLAKEKELFDHKIHFIRLINSTWPGLVVTGAISQWASLSFDRFIRELKKQKITLSLEEQSAWLIYFTDQKSKIDMLQTTISETDSMLDQMVFELYRVTPEERNILARKFCNG